MKTRKVFASVGMLALLVAPGFGQSLDAYWNANGNALDSSGNGNNGTLENGAAYGPGKFGQAFQLNGANQFVNVASPNFNLSATDFTISVWANFASLSYAGAGGLPNTLVAQDEGGGFTHKWALYYDASSSSLGFHINGPGSTPGFYEAGVVSAVNTGAWNMFSVTDLGGTLSLYEDGAFLGAYTGLVVPTASAPVTLGEAEGIGFVHGSLDDIRIYGSALSATQVQALYNNPVPEIPPAAVLGIGIVGLCWRRRRCKS